jgi:hypothetical protein
MTNKQVAVAVGTFVACLLVGGLISPHPGVWTLDQIGACGFIALGSLMFTT